MGRREDEQKPGISRKTGRETERVEHAPQARTILKNGETMLRSPSITHLISWASDTTGSGPVSWGYRTILSLQNALTSNLDFHLRTKDSEVNTLKIHTLAWNRHIGACAPRHSHRSQLSQARHREKVSALTWRWIHSVFILLTPTNWSKSVIQVKQPLVIGFSVLQSHIAKA